MLALFKLWRHPAELKNNSQTWKEEFESWKQQTSPYICSIIDNMQVLHECKDCQDDHFQKRLNRRTKNRIANEMTNTFADTLDGELGDDEVEDALLQHLDEIDRAAATSAGLAMDDPAVQECVGAMLDTRLLEKIIPDKSTLPMSGLQLEESTGEAERGWLKVYQTHHQQWRQTLADNEDDSPFDPPSNSAPPHHQQFHEPIEPSLVPAGPRPLPKRVNNGGMNVNAEPRAQKYSTTPEKLIDDIVREWTFNEEQALAFRIVAEHASLPCDETQPLRMYMGGAGGTGKSRVINALREFFPRRGELRRFRVASFTGVAAQNIGGMTLHTCLMLDCKQVSKAELGII